MSNNLHRRCASECPVINTYDMAIQAMEDTAKAMVAGSFRDMDDALTRTHPDEIDVRKILARGAADTAEAAFAKRDDLKANRTEIRAAIAENSCPGPQNGKCQSIGLCALRNDEYIQSMIGSVWTRPC